MAIRDGEHGKDDEDEDEELRALGGKTAITRLTAPLPSSLLRSYNRNSTERSEKDSHLTRSPMPIPLSSHLESVHPLLLQYVEQSRWVSNAYNEEPPTYANSPTAIASSSNIYSATYHTHNQRDDNNETFTPPSTQAQHQQHQEPHHHLHQAATQQNYHYNDYSMQSASTTADYGHAPANTNAWQVQPTHSPEHSQQQNHYQDYHDTQQQQQQHYYYTDPSLESYADPAEYSSNQYAAWQSHLEQLGLPF